MNNIRKNCKNAIKVITGGIGSGKSYVCKMLAEHGIQIYDCDAHAKRLMMEDVGIRHSLTALIGSEAYNEDGTLNKAAVACFLLQGEENNEDINSIVHPVVARDFLSSGLTWMESAIYFEAGFGKELSFAGAPYVICVAAPLEVRLQRIMQRDGISCEKAREWIDRQMPQEEKVALADFTIYNDGNDTRLLQQIEVLLRCVIISI